MIVPIPYFHDILSIFPLYPRHATEPRPGSPARLRARIIASACQAEFSRDNKSGYTENRMGIWR